jgi:hypothetical protein
MGDLVQNVADPARAATATDRLLRQRTKAAPVIWFCTGVAAMVAWLYVLWASSLEFRCRIC